MRVSCGCAVSTASPTLTQTLEQMGIQPIITSQVVRAVYEGDDEKFGQQIVNLFEREEDHTITVDYTDKERRKALRKAQAAVNNAKLHGH